MAFKKKEECPKPPAWLISFGDLMSLLLTFFILLYSMSIISLERFYEVLRGIISAFGAQSVVFEQGKLPERRRIDIPMENFYIRKVKYKELKKVAREIKAELSKYGIWSDYTVIGECLRIRVNTDKFFPPGEAKLYPEARGLVLNMCKKLSPFSLPIDIEGHTDNRPISTSIFPSNWELSVARAISVIRVFVNQCGYPQDKLTAVGFADTKPIADNNTPLGRQKNRRVEFCIKLIP
ncbi:MAG TPA: flagellar motor protein MotB [Aquifex aeolicus]|nr:flagellar motor protein MotB [Aquifex aeolicus]